MRVCRTTAIINHNKHNTNNSNNMCACVRTWRVDDEEAGQLHLQPERLVGLFLVVVIHTYESVIRTHACTLYLSINPPPLPETYPYPPSPPSPLLPSAPPRVSNIHRQHLLRALEDGVLGEEGRPDLLRDAAGLPLLYARHACKHTYVRDRGSVARSVVVWCAVVGGGD